MKNYSKEGILLMCDFGFVPVLSLEDKLVNTRLTFKAYWLRDAPTS
jgi:hypothetical protein